MYKVPHISKTVVVLYNSMKTKKRGQKPLFCTPAGARTLDTLIKSQVLYQLSYGCIIFVVQNSSLAELRVQRYGVFL